MLVPRTRLHCGSEAFRSDRKRTMQFLGGLLPNSIRIPSELADLLFYGRSRRQIFYTDTMGVLRVLWAFQKRLRRKRRGPLLLSPNEYSPSSGLKPFFFFVKPLRTSGFRLIIIQNQCVGRTYFPFKRRCAFNGLDKYTRARVGRGLKPAAAADRETRRKPFRVDGCGRVNSFSNLFRRRLHKRRQHPHPSHLTVPGVPRDHRYLATNKTPRISFRIAVTTASSCPPKYPHPPLYLYGHTHNIDMSVSPRAHVHVLPLRVCSVGGGVVRPWKRFTTPS